MKEISSTITSLALLKPGNYFAFLKQSLAQVMAPEAAEAAKNKRIETLCWLIHLLRVFYSQLCPLLNSKQASKLD